jgi:hypothetical protein
MFTIFKKAFMKPIGLSNQYILLNNLNIAFPIVLICLTVKGYFIIGERNKDAVDVAVHIIQF